MLNKIVLTGAAGKLGSVLRKPLAEMCRELVTTDVADSIAGIGPNETYAKADLSNLDQVMDVVEGADMVVHFGAIGDEAPWDDILQSNIVGAYTVWEAAHRHGVRRVVYASSIHAVWPSALQRIWRVFTGTSAASKASACGSIPAKIPSITPVRLAVGCRTAT